MNVSKYSFAHCSVGMITKLFAHGFVITAWHVKACLKKVKPNQNSNNQPTEPKLNKEKEKKKAKTMKRNQILNLQEKMLSSS